jgi:hypothetical protein
MYEETDAFKDELGTYVISLCAMGGREVVVGWQMISHGQRWESKGPRGFLATGERARTLEVERTVPRIVPALADADITHHTGSSSCAITGW